MAGRGVEDRQTDRQRAAGWTDLLTGPNKLVCASRKSLCDPQRENRGLRCLMHLSESLCAGFQELLVNKVKLGYHSQIWDQFWTRWSRIECVIRVFLLVIFKTSVFMNEMSCNLDGLKSAGVIPVIASGGRQTCPQVYSQQIVSIDSIESLFSS